MLDPAKVAKNFEAYDKEIGRLHKEIEALEAQIAAKDAAMAHLATVTLENLAGLRALIEVKDVALTRIVNECSRFPIKDGLAFRVESTALNGLAAPAREPEQKPMYSLEDE
jgi:cell division septum initiation protein DivIVA